MESALTDAHRDIGYSVPQKPKRGSNKTPWPEGQAISEQWISDGYAYRKKNGLHRINLSLEAERFVNRALATGARYTVWHRAWLNWCISPYCAGVAEPESTASAHAASDPLDVHPAVIKLWAKGIRTRDCGPQTLARAVEKGLLTIEQARRLGF